MTGDVVVRRVGDGETIFQEGDAADGIYVVMSGKVRIFRGKGDRAKTITVFTNGDFFGEMALFDNKPRSASAAAVGATELRFISASEFDGMMTDPFMRKMLTKMSERLRAVDDELSKVGEKDVARQEYVSKLNLRRDWVV